MTESRKNYLVLGISSALILGGLLGLSNEKRIATTEVPIKKATYETVTTVDKAYKEEWVSEEVSYPYIMPNVTSEEFIRTYIGTTHEFLTNADITSMQTNYIYNESSLVYVPNNSKSR